MPRIHTSPYPAVQVPTDESFWQYVLRHNVDDTQPDTVIMQEHERPEKVFTYESIRRMAGLGADALRDILGLKQGDTIMVIGKNTLVFFLLQHSGLWAGITTALVNPTATTTDLGHYITTVQPRAIFADAGDVLAKAIKAVDGFAGTYAADKPKPVIVSIGTRGATDLAFPADFIKDENKPYSPPLDLTNCDNRTAESIICFSSGTSGLSKAAVLSHHNMIAYLAVPRASDPPMANSQTRDVFYAPVTHIYGMFTSLLPIFCGNYIRYLTKYTLHEYVRASVMSGAKVLRMVPATLVGMAKDPFVRQQDLSKINTILCAGAVLAPEMIVELRQIMPNVSLVQGYGLTEGCATILRDYSASRKQGSVGRLMSDVQMRVVDDDLNDVPEGESGELLFTARTVFIGYKNNDAANTEAFPYGQPLEHNKRWLRTGDVGRIDNEGFLWLTDRKKDLIKYKGNQVSPAELESVLLSHHLVTEAGVCSTWDTEQLTEIPVGYVSLKSTVEATQRAGVLNEILQFANNKVSKTKKLRGGLFFLDKMPRNATGKLLRRQLPARLDATRKSKL